jgi:hypothetical protein
MGTCAIIMGIDDSIGTFLPEIQVARYANHGIGIVVFLDAADLFFVGIIIAFGDFAVRYTLETAR